MRFFSLVITFAVMSLSLAAPIDVDLDPEAQAGGIQPECFRVTCLDFKREE
jgi:hypothetical protein